VLRFQDVSCVVEAGEETAVFTIDAETHPEGHQGVEQMIDIKILELVEFHGFHVFFLLISL
jgi:hypothetical protein